MQFRDQKDEIDPFPHKNLKKKKINKKDGTELEVPKSPKSQDIPDAESPREASLR